MDISDQRMACLRLAMEMNCKTDPLLKAASELMDFIAHGTASAPQQESHADPIPEPPAEPKTAAEPSLDAIAACGTALLMPEVGGLALAEPVNPVPVVAEALASPAPVEAAVEAASDSQSEREPDKVAAPQSEPAEVVSDEEAEPETAATASEDAVDTGQTAESASCEPELQMVQEAAGDDASPDTSTLADDAGVEMTEEAEAVEVAASQDPQEAEAAASDDAQSPAQEAAAVETDHELPEVSPAAASTAEVLSEEAAAAN